MVLKLRAAQGTGAVIKAWREALDGIPAPRRFPVLMSALSQIASLAETTYLKDYLKSDIAGPTTTTIRSTAAPKKPGGKKGGKVRATRGRGIATSKRNATAGKTGSLATSGGRGRGGNRRSSQQTQTSSGNSETPGDSSGQLH